MPRSLPRAPAPEQSAPPPACAEGHAGGYTVSDVARRYRVGEGKVRGWIARGELRAVNTATVQCGKPRWVIPPEALEEFERGRRGGPAPKPARRRRRRETLIDYFPGE